MIDRTAAAQAYCVMVTKLETANLILKNARDVFSNIHVELEKLRNEIGEELGNDDSFVILLPENIAVVVSKPANCITVDISRTL